jgi:hypothetical protein
LAAACLVEDGWRPSCTGTNEISHTYVGDGDGGNAIPKSPHRVISNMRLWASKNLSTLQPPVGQLATGIPKVDVSMVLELDEKTLGT